MPAQETDPSAQPRAQPRSLDRHARKLIARIQRDHGDAEAIEALAAHYAKLADHASLANLMEGYAKTLTAAGAAAEAYVRAADAALLSADRKRAEALYERALMREPSHAEALDRAMRVAETAQDVQAMLRILGGALRAAQARGAEPKLLATLHFRLGQVYETYLQDTDRAAELYRLAMGHNPQLVKATAAARRLYAQAGNQDAVSVLYEFEIDVVKEDEDKRALLLALANHKAEHCHDLAGAVTALQRAAELDAGDVSTLRKLADAWVACSETRTGDAHDAALQQAAEVLFQLARAVQRADAAEVLARALTLDPEHARAAALLHELRGHAANTSAEQEPTPKSSHGQESQLVVDKRDTLKIFVPRDIPEPFVSQADMLLPLSAASPSRAHATSALRTSDLLPVRGEPASTATELSSSEIMTIDADEVTALGMSDVMSDVTADVMPLASRMADAFGASQREAYRSTVPPPIPIKADQVEALSTSDLEPIDPTTVVPPRARSEPPPFDPIALEAARRVSARSEPPPVPAHARRSEPPHVPEQVPIPLITALMTSELIPISVPPPLPDLTGRAALVEALEADPALATLEVSLGVVSESNLYVNVDNRLLDGGVFVASYQIPAPGTLLRLHIKLPGNLEAWAHGRVSLARDLDPFDDGVHGAYVAFETLTRESLALLGRFAAKRTPLLVDDS